MRYGSGDFTIGTDVVIGGATDCGRCDCGELATSESGHHCPACWDEVGKRIDARVRRHILADRAAELVAAGAAGLLLVGWRRR